MIRGKPRCLCKVPLNACMMAIVIAKPLFLEKDQEGYAISYFDIPHIQNTDDSLRSSPAITSNHHNEARTSGLEWNAVTQYDCDPSFSIYSGLEDLAMKHVDGMTKGTGPRYEDDATGFHNHSNSRTMVFDYSLSPEIDAQFQDPSLAEWGELWNHEVVTPSAGDILSWSTQKHINNHTYQIFSDINHEPKHHEKTPPGYSVQSENLSATHNLLVASPGRPESAHDDHPSAEDFRISDEEFKEWRVPPLNAIDFNMFENISKPFKGYFDTVFKSSPPSTDKVITLEELGVRLLRYDKYTLLRVVAPSGQHRRKATIVSSIDILIRWILYNLDKLLYSGIEFIVNYSTEDIAALFSWLYEALFLPNDGLPVPGRVECDIDTEVLLKFKPVQKWVLKHLSATGKGYSTSIAIIAIWMKRSGTWSFKADQEFWDLMNRTLRTAQISHKRKIGRSTYSSKKDVHYDKSRYLGNFFTGDHKIISALSSLAAFKRHRRSDLPRSRLEALKLPEQVIMDRITLYHRQICGIPRDKTKDFDDIWVGAVEICGKEPKYLIRILTQKIPTETIVLPVYKVTRRFDHFLKLLEYYHNLLESFLKTKTQRLISDPHCALLEWVSTQLFEPVLGHPIFGKVDKEKLNCLNRKAFGDVQVIIIDFLTKYYANVLEADHAILALIGYWYKNYHLDIWIDAFYDDIRYWKHMANVIWRS